MPRAGENETTLASSMLRTTDPVDLAYSMLEDAVTRYGLRDAWLVLHPPGLSTQMFRHARRPVGEEDVRRLAARATGLYGEPAIDAATGALLGSCVEAVFTARAASGDAMMDTQTGLLSRGAIDASLARASAAAARHRWSTTVVLVTTAGAGEAERWPALAAALGDALRSGDEAGVAAPGTVLALLGNAGADAVRPFLARVRAGLSAAGWDGADLLAAAATTPQESVDPGELRRLVTERLGELGAGPLALAPASALELELRLLPDVACVGTQQNGRGPELTVVRLGADAPEADIEATVRRHDPDLVVRVVSVGDGLVPAPSLAPVEPPPRDAPAVHAPMRVNGSNPNGVNGSRASTEAQSVLGESAPAVGVALARSATAPGTGGDLEHAPRVTLIASSFDPSQGMSEVTLMLGSARGTGRAPAGALVGGAQATLVALRALGRSLPFYLVSAERARSIPGEPVVVVLAPRDDAGEGPFAGERIGVAGGASDVEAASRAALAALNRFLARPVGGA